MPFGASIVIIGLFAVRVQLFCSSLPRLVLGRAVRVPVGAVEHRVSG
jgi:hypothetical protein